MTSYGTIPTSTLPESSSSSSSLQFVSDAKEIIKTGLGTRRPWKEMVRFQTISFPTSIKELMQRICRNINMYRMNYAIIILLTLFLSLLWHPISLIVFVVMMVAWLFLYFLRGDQRLVIFGHIVGDRIVLVGLMLVTVVSLYLTNAKTNIVIGLSIGVVVVLVHGCLCNTEDVLVVDEEALGSSTLNGKNVVRLKQAASSSFSSS